MFIVKIGGVKIGWIRDVFFDVQSSEAQRSEVHFAGVWLDKEVDIEMIDVNSSRSITGKLETVNNIHV